MSSNTQNKIILVFDYTLFVIWSLVLDSCGGAYIDNLTRSTSIYCQIIILLNIAELTMAYLENVSF